DRDLPLVERGDPFLLDREEDMTPVREGAGPPVGPLALRRVGYGKGLERPPFFPHQHQSRFRRGRIDDPSGRPGRSLRGTWVLGEQDRLAAGEGDLIDTAAGISEPLAVVREERVVLDTILTTRTDAPGLDLIGPAREDCDSL